MRVQDMAVEYKMKSDRDQRSRNCMQVDNICPCIVSLACVKHVSSTPETKFGSEEEVSHLVKLFM